MLKSDRFIKIGFFSLVIGHLFAAWFSFGYHHPDEHFQILEWAHYFLGLAPDTSHLPWEFGAQIRPWFQPLAHAAFMKLALVLGMYDPFSLAFFFRALYAALNIWSLWALWNYFQKKFELSSKWFLLISLIWFFPYIHVRTSSENLAGIFLSFALLALVRSERVTRHFYFAGILFGFAFLARYQIALGLVGLAAALLLTDRGIKKSHLVLAGGFFTTLALGLVLDRIGYGNWVSTPYQYFKVNILDHVAERYNPYPWYQYFLWILQLNPFVSLPLFYGVVRYSMKFPRDLFAAFLMSFFILHCFITNKEYRFLLPVLNFAPFMAAAYFQHATTQGSVEAYLKRVLWVPAFLFFYVVVNALSFLVSSFHGASTQTHWAVHAVDHHFSDSPRAVWLSNRDYLDLSHGRYYDLKAVKGFEPHEMHLFHDSAELGRQLQQFPGAFVLIDGKLQDPITSGSVALVEAANCSVVARAYPKFLSQRTNIPFQALYRCGN